MLLYKFEELYQQLRESALSGACTVLILVAADVDGLCACRSLTHLLRADQVTYSLVPVQGYSHVAALLRGLGESNNDIRTVILVNCGAIVNLGNLLPWDRPDLACYVVDSHRPIHLANVYDKERVFVLHDEEEDMEAANLPSDGEGLSGGEESSEGEEEEEEWDEEDGYGNGDGGDSSGGEDEWDADDGSRSRSSSRAEEEEEEEEEEEDEFSELASEDEADPSDDAGNGDSSTGSTPRKKKGKGKDKKGRRRKRDGDGSGSEMEEDDDGEGASLADRSAQSGGSRRSRRSRASSTGGGSGGGDGDGDEEGSYGSGGGSRRRGERPRDAERARRREERRARRARRERIAQYYLGAYYGAPSALVMHRVCQEVNRETRDTLWHAIVGLTDLLVHQRVEHAHYRQLVEGLEVEVRASQPAGLEPQGFAAEDGTLVPACEAGRIAVDFEYQFMLYRHWSLYEAMLHSPYVASKLLLWWAHGRQRLDELLAKMGFSLSQCKEAFKYMDADLKARLRDELDAHQDEYGLEEVFYLSFHRRMHYGAAVSAADVVHSVAALLEAWQGPPGSAADPAALLAAARTPEEEAAAGERIFTARFHEAYDALSGQDEQKLTEGIHLAMALQKAVFRTAVSLHDKKAVRALDHFRWAVVHNNLASAEDYLLTQPMAITRLAQLMIDVSREERGRAQARQGPNARALWRPKPFLIFAERRNTYLVVGVPCPEQRGEVVKHRFASLFRLAADGCKARYRHDGFDSAVLEIDKDSATRFTESLFLAYDAGRAPRSSRRRGGARGGERPGAN